MTNESQMTMNISPDTWLSEMEMEDPALVHQCQENSLEVLVHDYASFHLKTTTSETSQIGPQRPDKQLKTRHWDCGKEEKVVNPRAASSSSGNLISFANSNVNASDEMKLGQTQKACTAIRTPLKAKDHVLAERKRRERLSQRFISLSALLPGLKKLDKASVLGDAVKHIKELQEQIKSLEEEARNHPGQSVVCVKNSWLSGEDDSSSSGEIFGGSFTHVLPEIEVRVSENNVLIRIHCQRQSAFVGKIFSEVEKLNLLVINSSVMPFGHSDVVLNIVAQMSTGQSMTAEDLARSLRSALQN